MGSRAATLGALLLVGAVSAWAQDDGPTAEDVQTHANIIWTLLAAVLVFWMQAGFAFVESGFTRAKSAAHIMMKNLLDMCMGAISYWAIGFGLMFGASTALLIGGDHFFLSPDATTADGQWEYTFWMFQVVFAATAATIVSGAMAERTKFSSYIIYSLVISAVIYPVFGHWAWGNLLIGDNPGSWLAEMGFIDFAGSTVVHSVGGWAALAGAICVGARIGKFGKDGKVKPIPGHNMPMGALGVLILFMGWFGFNAGSTTTADGSVARIAVNTFLSGCAGGVAAMLASWMKFKKPDVGMTLNGVLAGLVGITAPCATVTPGASILIGIIAGVLVMYAVLFFDKIRIDDPVGAISVHGVCGVWGTLAAALFDERLFAGDPEYNLMGTLWVQVVGIVVAFVWTFGTAFILFKILDATIGLRVSEQEEIEGLDLAEHGYSAYPDFQVHGGPGISASSAAAKAASAVMAADSRTAEA
ncbi:MAG: ammonium transporter [Bryobacterales bacterium]|nr:ammonium transporter [Acidobacteriota bacterium]MCB9385018.1 ammonium transporter [Bryobacterales bacterium]